MAGTSNARARAERRERLRERQREQCKRRNERSGGQTLLDVSEYEEVFFYEMRKDRNEIDIFPYIVTDSKHPDLEKGEEDYKLDIYVHNKVGPKNIQVVCPLETYGKPCPICEDRSAQIAAGAEWDSKEMQNLKAKRRVFYNVLDLLDPEKGIQILHTSHYKFEKELYDKAQYEDEAFVTYADIEEGYTVEFRGVDSVYQKKKFIEPKDFNFIPRDAYDEAVYDEVYPLDAMLKVLSYDELEKLHYSIAEEEEEEERTSVEEKSRSQRFSIQNRGKKIADRKSKKLVSGKKQKTRSSVQVSEKLDELEENEEECPYTADGLTFGVDFGTMNECGDCQVETPMLYDACELRNSELNQKAADEEKAEKKKSPPKRTPPKGIIRRNRNR